MIDGNPASAINRESEGKMSAINEINWAEDIITNGRGNGCGGPGFIKLQDWGDMTEEVTEVDEEDDAEAWELARDACEAHGCPEPTRVFVGVRACKGEFYDPSGHQMIYAE